MNVLLSLYNTILSKNLCSSQLIPLCKAINNNQKLLAWQIILGNKTWCEHHNIDLPINLEQLANNIGLIYHQNESILAKFGYKDGKINGILEIFDNNKILIERCNIKNNTKNGLTETFYKNGQVKFRINYDIDKVTWWEMFDETGYLILKG